MTLFRREIVATNQDRLLGRVVVIEPLSTKLLADTLADRAAFLGQDIFMHRQATLEAEGRVLSAGSVEQRSTAHLPAITILTTALPVASRSANTTPSIPSEEGRSNTPE